MQRFSFLTVRALGIRGARAHSQVIFVFVCKDENALMILLDRKDKKGVTGIQKKKSRFLVHASGSSLTSEIGATRFAHSTINRYT